VVLRTQKLGEADRIITILARKTGRVRRGQGRAAHEVPVRRAAGAFTHANLMLYPGRSLDVITQAEVIRPYGAALTPDYPRYTAGVAMLETAERFTSEDKEPSLRQFCCSWAGCAPSVRRVVIPGWCWTPTCFRSLSVAGYAPALEECARCGTRGRLPAFAIPAGGMVCGAAGRTGRRRPAGDRGPDDRPAPGGLGECGQQLERRHQVECSGLVAAYLQWHLEHSIRSLRHVGACFVSVRRPVPIERCATCPVSSRGIRAPDGPTRWIGRPDGQTRST